MALSHLDKYADIMPHLPAAAGGGGGASIGGAVTGATDGSVLFVGAGGVLAQDNANFFFDDTDNQLVMGAGTVGKPSIIFGDDTTGIYRPALDQVAISVGGALALSLGVAPTAADVDMKVSVGRVLIDSRTSDRAHFSHRDMSSTTQYALVQTATGATTVNSVAGTNVSLAVANNTKWALNGTNFDLSPGVDASVDFGQSAFRIRRMFLAEFWEGSEIADPAAPGADKGRLYFKDNGAAKTQLVVRFPTGAVQVIATEP